MQPIPGCRILVWKKEWLQTVGSQTSLTTGTRSIANRVEQKSRRRKEGGDTTGEGEEKEVCGDRNKEVGSKEADGWFNSRLRLTGQSDDG